jgi:hypothetical protein
LNLNRQNVISNRHQNICSVTCTVIETCDGNS